MYLQGKINLSLSSYCAFVLSAVQSESVSALTSSFDDPVRGVFRSLLPFLFLSQWNPRVSSILLSSHTALPSDPGTFWSPGVFLMIQEFVPEFDVVITQSHRSRVGRWCALCPSGFVFVVTSQRLRERTHFFRAGPQ